jgi:hypothetical protein
MADNWGIYCKCVQSTVLMKYSSMEFKEGNSWSSKVNDWEKPVQLAHLVIQFGYLDTAGDSVDTCKISR